MARERAVAQLHYDSSAHNWQHLNCNTTVHLVFALSAGTSKVLCPDQNLDCVEFGDLDGQYQEPPRLVHRTGKRYRNIFKDDVR